MRRLIRQIVFHDPVSHYVIIGNKNRWIGLPRSKSLFYSKPGCGLPIGNLTSQLFANIYLNDFDHFIKRDLKIKNYGRYVDDMVFVHQNKEHLKSIIPEIRLYLKNNLKLELHERKAYLQHYTKGVKFLGAFLKPYRIYADRRVKGNFYKRIKECNFLLESRKNKLNKTQTESIVAGINSYLGLLSHFKAIKLKKMIINEFSVYFWNYAYIRKGYLRKR